MYRYGFKTEKEVLIPTFLLCLIEVDLLVCVTSQSNLGHESEEEARFDIAFKKHNQDFKSRKKLFLSRFGGQNTRL